MHPVITQAIAAERTREMRAYAATAGRARQLRRSRQARRTPLLLVTLRPGRRPVSLPALRPMRGPRAA